MQSQSGCLSLYPFFLRSLVCTHAQTKRPGYRSLLLVLHSWTQIDGHPRFSDSSCALIDESAVPERPPCTLFPHLLRQASKRPDHDTTLNQEGRRGRPTTAPFPSLHSLPTTYRSCPSPPPSHSRMEGKTDRRLPLPPPARLPTTTPSASPPLTSARAGEHMRSLVVQQRLRVAHQLAGQVRPAFGMVVCSGIA